MNLKHSLLIISLVGAVGMIAASAAAAQQGNALLSLKGLDPVMLVKGKEVKGNPDISVTRAGFRYLFSTAENKAAFEKEPKKYEIQMGGSCPVVPSAEGDPDRFYVYKERIYIFASDHCVESFKENPEQYISN